MHQCIPSIINWLLLDLTVIFTFSSSLDELLNDLVVVSVLASFLVIVVVQVLLNFQLTGQSKVIGIDPSGSGGQCGVAILLSPFIEDAGKESRMP